MLHRSGIERPVCFISFSGLLSTKRHLVPIELAQTLGLLHKEVKRFRRTSPSSIHFSHVKQKSVKEITSYDRGIFAHEAFNVSFERQMQNANNLAGTKYDLWESYRLLTLFFRELYSPYTQNCRPLNEFVNEIDGIMHAEMYSGNGPERSLYVHPSRLGRTVSPDILEKIDSPEVQEANEKFVMSLVGGLGLSDWYAEAMALRERYVERLACCEAFGNAQLRNLDLGSLNPNYFGRTNTPPSCSSIQLSV